MSWCPELLEVFTIADGTCGTVVELIGEPCHGFILEVGDGEFISCDQFGNRIDAPSSGPTEGVT